MTDDHVPLRFSTNVMGHSMALCHHNPSQCGFSRESSLSFSGLVTYNTIFAVNLNEARHTAVLESMYNHVLTQGKLLDSLFLQLFLSLECRSERIFAYDYAKVATQIPTATRCHTIWSCTAYALL